MGTFFVLPVQTQLSTYATESGFDVVPVAQAEAALIDAGLSPDQAAAVAADYGAAQLDGLRNALGAVAFFAVLAFWFTRRLPAGSTRPAPDEVPAVAPDPIGAVAS